MEPNYPEEPVSRPTTPKWWRPSVPPETYLWEEVRREKKKGKYPYTHMRNRDLDLRTPGRRSKRISHSNPVLPTNREHGQDMDKINKRYSENLYEPVEGNLAGSANLQQHSDEDDSQSCPRPRIIDIPPDIEIVSSDGLDGLDQPDSIEMGMDGDKEWKYNLEDEHRGGACQRAASFTAGIRNQELPRYGETSSVRPLQDKGSSGSKKAPKCPGEQDYDDDEEFEDQEVPQSDHLKFDNLETQKFPSEPPEDMEVESPQQAGPAPKAKKLSAFEQLKSKAGAMKKKIAKISLPVRPKFNDWTGIKKTAGKNGKKRDDQKVPEKTDTEPEPEMEIDFTLGPSRSQDSKKGGKKPAGFDSTVIPAEFMSNTVDDGQKTDGQMTDEGAWSDYENAPRPTKAQPAETQYEPVGAEPSAELAEAKAKEAKEAEKLRKEEEKLQKEAEKLRKEEEKKAKLAEKERKAEEMRKLKEEARLAKEAKEAQEMAEKLKIAEAKKIADEEKALKKKAEEEEKIRLKKIADEEKLRLKEIEEAEKAKMRAIEDQKKRLEAEEKWRQNQEKFEKELSNHPEAEFDDEEMARIRAKEIERLREEDQKLLKEMDVGGYIQDEEEIGSGSSRKKEKRRKLLDLDFSKRFKRSKSPQKIDPIYANDPSQLENQLAAQYSREIEKRKLEEEMSDDEDYMAPADDNIDDLRASFRHDPQILVTQPSTEKTEKDLDNKKESEEPGSSSGFGEKDKEKKDFSEKLMNFGLKSKDLAAQTSKGLGKKMKVIGKDLKVIGNKCQAKFQEYQKAKAQQQQQQQAQNEQQQQQQQKQPQKQQEQFKDYDYEKIEGEIPSPPSTVSRSKKKGVKKPPKNDDEDQKLSTFYQNSEEIRLEVEKKFKNEQKLLKNEKGRDQILGRAERDWESPAELVRSRDGSEEPGFSSRDSPGPGSSMASSSALRSRSRQGQEGVLEEIDSDEFFLRERGISEGDNEEEVNRMLADELREAFRPVNKNALKGFDLSPAGISPPERPERAGRLPRKPPRTTNNKSSTNFQTFPPERPKRKQLPGGYVSSYMRDHPQDQIDQMDIEEAPLARGDEEDLEDFEMGSSSTGGGLGGGHGRLRSVSRSSNPQDDDEDEGIRRLKDQLRKMEQSLSLEDPASDNTKYEYEPVGQMTEEEPERPKRSKRPKRSYGTTGPGEEMQPLYYNTIAGNEWRNEVNEVRTEGHEVEVLDDAEVVKGTLTLSFEVEEDGVLVQHHNADGQLEVSQLTPPVRPQRPQRPQRREVRGKSDDMGPHQDGMDEDELDFCDEIEVEEFHSGGGHGNGKSAPLAQAESETRMDEEYLDMDMDMTLDLDHEGYGFDDEGSEPGYAVVNKGDRPAPATTPRRKKKKNGSKSGSLKRRSGELTSITVIQTSPSIGDTGADDQVQSQQMFFSLPRYTPRTFHIVPPSRPLRTYSTLKPKRPPRKGPLPPSRSSDGPRSTIEGQGQGQVHHLTLSPSSPRAPHVSRRERELSGEQKGSEDVDERPPSGSIDIGQIQGRPLPPPPRPAKSPQPPHRPPGEGQGQQMALGHGQGQGRPLLNDLDQTSLERAVGLRHYINLSAEGEDLERSISSFGGDLSSSIVGNSEVNIGVQTDPLRDEDYELNINIDDRHGGHGLNDPAQDEIQKRIEILRNSAGADHRQPTTTTGGPSPDHRHMDHYLDHHRSPTPRAASATNFGQQSTGQLQPEVNFPRRLHLDELEVDFLRVGELSANSLSIQEQIQTPHLDTLSLTARGPLILSSIESQSLGTDELSARRTTTDRLDCNRLAVDEADLPAMSIPPASFFQLANPPSSDQGVVEGGQEMSPEEEMRAKLRDQMEVDQARSRVRISRAATLQDRPSTADSEDVGHLSLRLGRALIRVTIRSLQAMSEYIDEATSSDPLKQSQARSQMQLLLCLLLVILAGIFLWSGKSSTPKWEFFMPPPDL